MTQESRPPTRVPRPGSIGYDDEPSPRDYYSRQQKQGTNWMPGIVGAVIAVIISAVMMFLVNPNKGAITTLTDQIVQVNASVNTLSGKVADSSTRIDNLTNTTSEFVKADALNGLASQATVADLSSQLSTLSTNLGKLQTEVDGISANLTKPASNGTSTPSGVLPRWTFRTPVLLDFSAGDGASFSSETPLLRVEHIKIQEDGSYEFALDILNSDDTLPSAEDTSVKIQLVLTPNGDALLDESSTDIYTNDMPEDWFDVAWIDWQDPNFTQVTKGTTDITRRVTFETENFHIPSIEAGNTESLDLVLDLHYAT